MSDSEKINVLQGKDKPVEVVEQERVNPQMIPPKSIGERNLEDNSVGADQLMDDSVSIDNIIEPLTLTSPVLNGSLSGTAFLDEDAMTSNSAVATASQQSIKAYVDASATSLTFTTWSPTFANITAGDGTTVARYMQNGKLVVCWFYFKLGSTSAMGTLPTITLPVTAHASYGSAERITVGSAGATDASADQNFLVSCLLNASTTVLSFHALDATTTYGTNGSITATVPFAWTTDDVLSAQFTYEAA